VPLLALLPSSPPAAAVCKNPAGREDAEEARGEEKGVGC
jgi:hypothetical protein